MTPAIDLRPDHRKIVEDTLRDHLPDGVKVWVFGSRAEWTTKDSSDLDLALESDNPLDTRTLMALELAFEESLLPFRVDVVDLARVDAGFRQVVLETAGCLVAVTSSLRKVRDAWREVTIGEAARVVGGGTPPTGNPANFGGEVPWITPRDLSGPHDRYIAGGSRCLSQQGLANSAARLLPKESVLLSTRAPIGYVALAKNPIATNQGFRSLIMRPGWSPQYFYYWLLANTEELERRASGSTFRELPGSVLKSLRLAVPELPEQMAISSILGCLDDRIELNRRMNQTLEAMLRALFKSWFVDFDPVRAKMEGRDSGLPRDIAALFPDRLVDSELGEIPEGWDTTTLGDLCEPPQYGYTASARDDPIGPRFLRITDINKRSWITWDDVPYCAISSADLIKYRLQRGDILIARMADPGHGVLIEDDELAVFASYLIRFRPLDPGVSRFLQYWLRSRGYWEVVSGRFSGTTRMNINARQLRSLPLVVPSSETIETFASQTNALRAVVVSSAKETSRLTQIRDNLLPKLTSGEVRLPATLVDSYVEPSVQVGS